LLILFIKFFFMSFSVEKLSNVSDCESVTKLLEKEKDDLDFRGIVLSRQIKSYAGNATDITADLIATDAEITSLNAQLEVVPAGDRREKLITDLDRAKLRKRTLTARQLDYGTVALVEREVELAMANAQLGIVTAGIADVATRKAAL
jgi:hypothetical protein